eukprot:CAMPEP_0201957218 /NCGR_PEP_ID=MMETSP0904-20121228/4624_1 /ASSEMBLY_ACC=CAM_ASM_000553 /TAXON_ID=420261 /ORGANISM="Thalassiosira antarctica, Strain CCMP982" /LENGTH=60 /DNA_ID=CAMNT_0048502155 /DNA_START=16 /DNA_END=195 /DNA_ORIENTATION=+
MTESTHEAGIPENDRAISKNTEDCIGDSLSFFTMGNSTWVLGSPLTTITPLPKTSHTRLL